MYIYNNMTGTLHIEGLCKHLPPYPYRFEVFATEKEAYDKTGQNIHMCKDCQRKRDKLMKVATTEKG